MASILEIIVSQKKKGSGIKQSEKDVKGLGKTLDKVSVAGVAAAGALAAGFVAISVKSVMLAGDIEEMDSKFVAVFKHTAPEVRAELEKFGKEVSRSRFELLEMASTVQDTFVPLGFARDEAAKMSVTLTKLAVDVASFNNASEPEVMKAFQSAIVGNTESVRQFGIVIMQPTINAELLRMGIEGGLKAATESEKAYARMNLILAGTADAHGDAARTAGSFVNQMKALKAQTTELQVAWGKALLPTIQRIVPVLTEVTETIAGDIDKWNMLQEATDSGALSVEEAQKIFEEASEDAEGFAIIQQILTDHTLDQAAAFDASNQVIDGWRVGLVDAMGDVEEGAGETADALDDVADTDLSPLEQQFKDAAGKIDNAKRTSREFWQSIDTGILGSINRLQETIAFMLAGGTQVQAAFNEVETALRESLIAPEEAETALREIEAAALGVQVETGNIDMTDAIEQLRDGYNLSWKEAKQLILDAKQFVDSIPFRTEKHIDMIVEYHYRGEGPGGAHGLDMIVPPGFPNDTFPVRATSGERVTITPQGGGNLSVGDISVTVPPGTDGGGIVDEILAELGRRTRIASSSGAGFIGS